MRPASKLNVHPKTPPARPSAAARPSVGPLADQKEALDFLAGRSIPTAFMTTLIRDNGLKSPLNRGTFYGCRDGAGRLEGVALVGHATMFEARTEGALRAFAELAKDDPRACVLLGEQEEAARFVNYYAGPS